MTWLLNNMDEKTIASVIFLKTAKEIWDTLKEMHSNKQNISFVGMHSFSKGYNYL